MTLVQQFSISTKLWITSTSNIHFKTIVLETSLTQLQRALLKDQKLRCKSLTLSPLSTIEFTLHQSRWNNQRIQAVLLRSESRSSLILQRRKNQLKKSKHKNVYQTRSQSMQRLRWKKKKKILIMMIDSRLPLISKLIQRRTFTLWIRLIGLRRRSHSRSSPKTLQAVNH